MQWKRLLCSPSCISSKHLYIIKSEIVALHFSNQQWHKSVKTLRSTEMHSVGVRNFWAQRTPGWVLFRTRRLRQGFSSPRKLRKDANNIKCKAQQPDRPCLELRGREDNLQALSVAEKPNHCIFSLGPWEAAFPSPHCFWEESDNSSGPWTKGRSDTCHR